MSVVGITPKFAYNDGSLVDWTPTYPPMDKTPYAPLEAVRHDSVTSSGLFQTVVERVDEFLILNFKFVPEADLADWRRFFDWVIQGNQFTYYPDSTVPATYFELVMEDQSWAPKRDSYKNYSFTVKFRKAKDLGQHYS